MRPRSTGILATLGLFFLALPTLAQDDASAAALFDHGVADMEAGRFVTGCPALAESQRLDPRPGTLFTLAECESKWEKVASAVAHYNDYLGLVSRLPPEQQARHRDRVLVAEAALERIKPSVPWLTLVLPPDAPKGAVVIRDGVPLLGPSLGIPLPVDPGEHVIVTRVPGGPDKEIIVALALGEKRRVALEVLSATGPPPSVEPTRAPSPEPPSPAATARKAPREAAPPAGENQRTWAYVAGGLGSAAFVAGSIAGMVVMSKKGTVDDECDGRACTAEGLAAAKSGRSFAVVANVAFGLSAAGFAAAAVLFQLAPGKKSERRAAASVTPVAGADRHGGFAGLGGRF